MLRDMPSRKPSSGPTVVLDPALVMSRTGLDHLSIVAGVAAGTFPKPVRVSDRVVWKQDDISEWISARIVEGDAALIALNPITPAHLRLINALAKAFVTEHLQTTPATPCTRAAHDDVKDFVVADASTNAPETSAMTGTAFLTFAQVSAKVGLGRTSIYAGMAAKPPAFPMPVKIGRRSLWVEAEIEAWMQQRIAERDGAGQ